ncbi:MAG: hypothetical protein AAFY13_11360 [Pseudomonadota bacterium]
MRTLFLSLIVGFAAGFCGPAVAETTIFPTNAYGVAGPIPEPGNLTDLVGAPDPDTRVRFDPGDLGFLRFGQDISGTSTSMGNASLLFNIASSVPSASGAIYVSVLLGNIIETPGGGLDFTLATTPGLTAPDGSGSIFEFTEVPGGTTGLFEVNTDSFVAACAGIGGCNTIVIGTSGLGLVGGSTFVDGGTLTFSSVVAATPEPDTWFFMILGFAGLGHRLKRQRQPARETQRGGLFRMAHALPSRA